MIIAAYLAHVINICKIMKRRLIALNNNGRGDVVVVILLPTTCTWYIGSSITTRIHIQIVGGHQRRLMSHRAGDLLYNNIKYFWLTMWITPALTAVVKCCFLFVLRSSMIIKLHITSRFWCKLYIDKEQMNRKHKMHHYTNSSISCKNYKT